LTGIIALRQTRVMVLEKADGLSQQMHPNDSDY
jgi:hypothetical protein